MRMRPAMIEALDRAEQPAEKLAGTVGRGFNPDISGTKSKGPSGPEVYCSEDSREILSFSATFEARRGRMRAAAKLCGAVLALAAVAGVASRRNRRIPQLKRYKHNQHPGRFFRYGRQQSTRGQANGHWRRSAQAAPAASEIPAPIENERAAQQRSETGGKTLSGIEQAVSGPPV